MLDNPATLCHRLGSAAASVNATLVQAGRSRLHAIQGYNAKASGVYLKLYDKATAPTDADTPIKSIYLPPASAFALEIFFAFEEGLGYRLTTDVADGGTTALAAGDILGLNIDYRRS